jgi:hypothetical protein
LNYNFKLYLKEKKILVSEGPIPLVKYELKSFIENNKEDARWNEWKECREWLIENHAELLL